MAIPAIPIYTHRSVIAGIAVHSSVRHYHMPTRFGITDRESGRLSQWQSTVWRMHRYKAYSDRMSWFSSNPDCPAGDIQKTPVQSRAVYICTISGRGDLTCVLYIVYFFGIFLQFAPGSAWRFLYGIPARSSRFGDTPNMGIYICVYIYI